MHGPFLWAECSSGAARLLRRGTVIGILKAFLGLSASAFVTLYVSFLDRDAAAFVLLLAILPALACALCAPVINYVRPRPRASKPRLSSMRFLSSALVA